MIDLSTNLREVSLDEAFQMINLANEWDWFTPDEWEYICNQLDVDYHADWDDPSDLFDAMRKAKARRDLEFDGVEVVYVTGIEKLVNVDDPMWARELIRANEGSFYVRHHLYAPLHGWEDSRFIPDVIEEAKAKTNPNYETHYIPYTDIIDGLNGSKRVEDAVMDAIYHDFTHIGLFDKDNNQYATVNMIDEEA